MYVVFIQGENIRIGPTVQNWEMHVELHGTLSVLSSPRRGCGKPILGDPTKEGFGRKLIGSRPEIFYGL
jgi:hypothetical protein